MIRGFCKWWFWQNYHQRSCHQRPRPQPCVLLNQICGGFPSSFNTRGSFVEFLPTLPPCGAKWCTPWEDAIVSHQRNMYLNFKGHLLSCLSCLERKLQTVIRLIGIADVLGNLTTWGLNFVVVGHYVGTGWTPITHNWVLYKYAYVSLYNYLEDVHTWYEFTILW